MVPTPKEEISKRIIKETKGTWWNIMHNITLVPIFLKLVLKDFLAINRYELISKYCICIWFTNTVFVEFLSDDNNCGYIGKFLVLKEHMLESLGRSCHDVCNLLSGVFTNIYKERESKCGHILTTRTFR